MKNESGPEKVAFVFFINLKKHKILCPLQYTCYLSRTNLNITFNHHEENYLITGFLPECRQFIRTRCERRQTARRRGRSHDCKKLSRSCSKVQRILKTYEL